MFVIKFPNFIISIFKKLKSTLGPRLNTYAEEILWKYRHKVINNFYSDFGERRGLRRKQIVDLVNSKAPFKNLLEVGCGNAINIDIISNEIPKSNFIGFDINKKIIELNKKRYQKKSNLNFYLRNINNLKLCKDNAFDYVLTDAVLIYIHPDKISKIISELLRISRKGLILKEQHSEKTKYFGHWIHNYTKILRDLKIKNFNIIKTYGQEGLWDKYGNIFDINH